LTCADSCPSSNHQFGIPFAPGIEVQSCEDQSPLAAVGEQCESFVAGPEPLDDLAGGAASATDAELFSLSRNTGRSRAVGAAPELPGSDAFPGGCAAAPFGSDSGPAPPDACGLVEATDAFEDEGDERGWFAVAGEEGRCLATQFVLVPV
jgi:hypothetical protein